MADPYRAHGRFVAPAGVSGTIGQIAFAGLAIIVSWWLIGSLFLSVLSDEDVGGVTRPGFLLNMALFVILLGLTARIAAMVHGRHWPSFFGDWARVLPDFVRVFGACAAIYAVFIVLGWDASTAQMRPLAGWLAFLPFVLVGLFIQTGAEEVLYRGYLQQQVAALSRNPVVWIGVPSVLFGLTHVFNDTSSVATSVAYVVWTTAFGIACADLTGRTGSLGAAWGLHMAVNIAALCIASRDGAPLSAAALYLFPERSAEYVPETGLIVANTIFELIFLAVLWLAARNAIRR